MRQIPPIISGDRLGLLIRLIGNGFAQAVTTVTNGLLIEFAFDELIVTTIKQEFNQTAALIGLGLATAALVTGLLRMAERADAERIGQDYTYEIRMGLYERLTSLSPRALQNRSQGGVMLRFVGDLTALRQWVSLGLARLTVSATTAIVALLILSFVSSGLALTVGVILLIGTAIAFCLGRPMQSAAKEARRRRSHLAANINEKIASVAVVQVFGQSKREKKRMDRQSRLLQDAMVTRAIITGQLRAVTESTASLAMAGALLVGAIEVAADRASPGTVVAAMTIVGLIVPSLRDLGRVQEYWHNSRVSLEKIHEFLQTPSLVKEAPNAPELKLGEGCLEFDQVSLEGVLHQFSAIAKPGKIIALVGANGAGKSTLLSLAARLLDPDQGTIYLDGQDISQYSLASLRRAIGMASPDLPLLRGTVAKNLTYRWSAAPEEEIQRVRELCSINEVLANLPHGDQTKISEGGAGLSAGQRQRIALARALLGNPPVLLLDEVDANLDSQATAIVDRILAQHQGTIIFIAHRLERLLVADEIWYLENGRVIESGSPAQILQNDGPTARLFANGREVELFA